MDTDLDRIANLIEQARFDEAAALAEALRRRCPQAAEPARLHGIALLSRGAVVESIDAFEAAIQCEPTNTSAHCNLASALLAAGQAKQAITVLEHALTLAPGHPAVLNGLGNARRATGALGAAREAFLAATRAAPNQLGAWLNLAAVELALEHPLECERISRMILRQLAHPQASLLLAQALFASKRLEEAAEVCQQALRTAPDVADLAFQYGQILDELKQTEDAAAAYAQALELDPALSGALSQLVFLRRQLGDWRDLDALSTRLRQAVAAGAPGITPFGFLAEPATAAEQRRCAETFAAQVLRGIDPNSTPLRQARSSARTRLRLGFASNGFGNHPTGLLTVAFFEALGKLEVDLHLIATAEADGSPVQQRLAACGQWHVLADLPAATLAERIAALDLDILIDLRVWGGGHVSAALARRPAPVQVQWLAYPGTSGAPWIDHVIADPIVLPSHLHAHFSEKVSLLPRCFQPSDPTRTVTQPPSRSECGLPEQGCVYVCFNNSYKLDPRSLHRHFAILAAVPDAVLWLLSGPGSCDARLREKATAAGIDPARLVFMRKLPHAEYLARYQHADLFLDTASYNAHTTASDALWAGCPVLTCPGETFASRVAASLNHHLGMPELNVADDAAYITFAIRVGTDADHRRALRQRVAEQRSASSLFEMRGFAADFLATVRPLARP